MKVLNSNKFQWGQVVATRGVNEMIKEDVSFSQFVLKSFARHCNGDWGDLGEEDKHLNDLALLNGDDRLVSKYNFNDEISIYIITEWNRSATTILFPSEY